MISLRKDPKGENVFVKGKTLSSVETGESTLRKTTDSDTVTALRTRIKQLETELNTYKVIMAVVSFIMLCRTFLDLGLPKKIVLVMDVPNCTVCTMSNLSCKLVRNNVHNVPP